ncbi:MAG: urea carboxylase-associated family protein [Nocardiopsaceae bacterium]|nr:urea carboxylase-associated family protein [Nocardiopsaceae bacterium]
MTSTPLQRTVVPPRHGRAVALAAGQRVRVIDIEGGQVGDVFAFVSGARDEYHSAAHTRAHVNRLFPALGEPFVTNLRRPVLTLVEDTSPGHHDMLIPACDPERYAALGAPPDHRSCAQNLAEALAEVGESTAVIPQPINVFMRIPVDTDGRLGWLAAETRPGDSITFQANLDCVVAVSACPQDIVDINHGRPTTLEIEVIGARN